MFEGKPFSVGDGVIKVPSAWKYLWNPFRPSWGEPYKEVAERMWSAVLDARDGGRGPRGRAGLPPAADLDRAAARRAASSYLHDPRKRQCTLCSLTSFTFDDEHLVAIGFSEPAGDLIPLADRKANFSSGGDVADNAPPA